MPISHNTESRIAINRSRQSILKSSTDGLIRKDEVGWGVLWNLAREKEVLGRDGKLTDQGGRREDGVANLCPVPILKVFSFIQSNSTTIPNTPNPEKGHLLSIAVVVDLETNPQLNGCKGVEIFCQRIVAELGSCFVPVSYLDNDSWKMLLRA